MTTGRTRPGPFPLSLKSQQGASLLSIMIAVTIIMIGVAVAAVAFKQRIYARRLAAVSAAGRDVSGQFTYVLLNAFKNYIDSPSPCANSASLQTFNIGANTGRLAKTTQISLPGGNIPTDFSQAVNRCTGNSSFAGGISAGPNATQVYGCYLFTPAATAKTYATQDSFMQAQTAFVEFTGLIQNFATTQPATCATAGAAGYAALQAQTQAQFLLSGSGYGLAGYYGIHWVSNNGTAPIYKSQYGTVYSGL